MSYLLDKLPSLSPPVIDEPWRKALRDAAEIIRRKGWCQHEGEDPEGRVCALRAIADAADAWGHLEVYFEARNAFVDYNGCGVANWNDHPSRTKDEVISALLQAAGKE